MYWLVKLVSLFFTFLRDINESQTSTLYLIAGENWLTGKRILPNKTLSFLVNMFSIYNHS